MPYKDENLSFQVDAGLLFQLGEQLVARRSIALAELVKNSYDADATKVTVLLENVTKKNGTIIVEDNGTGMTFEHIRDSWMTIATIDKVRNPISPIYGRPRTGAKGVGRFASRKLANKLVLHSVAERKDGKKEKTIIQFEWGRDFSPGQALTQIAIPFERNLVDNNTPTGVLLYLEDARDIWNEEDVVELEQDLFSLVSPFPEDVLRPTKKHHKGDAGFSISIEAPEFPNYSGEMGERFLSAAWGVLRGVINEKGVAEYTLDVRNPKERIRFSPKEKRFAGLSNAKFRIHYFVYKPDYFRGLAFSARQAARLGRDEGGIKIYQDGFRVFPYGDPNDDWLGLDLIRARRTVKPLGITRELEDLEETIKGRPYLLSPSNNQLFGAVSISRLEHPTITLNISRERLVQNQSFYDLQDFVRIGINWLTLQYTRIKEREDAKKRPLQKAQPSASEVLNEAKTRIQGSKDITSTTKQEIISVLNLASERVDAEEEEFISELSMLRVLASTGVVVSMMNHQLRGVIDGLRAIHTDLSELEYSIPKSIRPKFNDTLTEMREWKQITENQVSQLGFLLGKEARKRRQRLPLKQVIEEVTKPLSLYRKDFGITVENNVPAGLRTPPIFEAELHALLLQIFTNALKAVRETTTRKISIEAYADNNSLHIRMYDTGIGLPTEERENAFKPFETTSAPDPVLGIGTGLGLWIVNEIVRVYAGNAHFIDAENPWNTCIEIVLPHER